MTPLLSDATVQDLPLAVARPTYDRSKLKAGIVHIGVGNFHRSHQALAMDRLFSKGLALDWAICGAGIMPNDQRMLRVMSTQDCLYTLVQKNSDGTVDARVIGSIVDYLYGPDDPDALVEKLSSPDTKIVSLTITEGGYNFDQVTGEFIESNPDVQADLVPGSLPRSVFGYVTEALSRRRARGIPAFTVLSCDNIQQNGEVASRVFRAFAALRDPALASWITEFVRFPNSMVDRITPGTTEQDVEDVASLIGMRDGWPVVAEPFFQWVVEDTFTMGRPPYEEADVQMVVDVEPYEVMKIRLLNGGHQTLAYFGLLSGHTYVHEAASDPVLERLLRMYMELEAVPTLPPVPGVDVAQYVDSGIRRFQNPAIKDTLSRICAYTSDRIPKFLLPVVIHQLQTGGPIQLSAAVVASWARYAEGLDEDGNPIEVVDQLLDEITAAAGAQRARPLAFIENRNLFGNLVDDERFRNAYLTALQSIFERGAHETVSTLVE